MRERFGNKCLRVFRLLMLKKSLEQKQVADLAMIPSKEVKELLYSLLAENYITLQVTLCQPLLFLLPLPFSGDTQGWGLCPLTNILSLLCKSTASCTAVAREMLSSVCYVCAVCAVCVLCVWDGIDVSIDMGVHLSTFSCPPAQRLWET